MANKTPVISGACGAMELDEQRGRLGDQVGGFSKLALVAIVVGGLSGLAASLFRLLLEHSDRWRDLFISWGNDRMFFGFLMVVGVVAGATAVSAWLVRRFAPDAGGSGIPHVEAVLNGDLPPAPPSVIPVKFVGGWLAIGAGLALGREGPSVQMGAVVGSILSKVFRLRAEDCRALLAAGAGAGLATAFNAPVAGAVFVLEELVRRFETRIAIAALASSAGAISVARVFTGHTPDFQVEAIPYCGLGSGLLFLAFGGLAGLMGVVYNRMLMATLAFADRFGRWPVVWRAGTVGAAVGVLAWCAPSMVGGGDALTQRALSGAETIALLPLAFLLRFVLGAASYAAGTPGGLFAPMLVLGAQLGVMFGSLCHVGAIDFGVPSSAFAVIGMAAFFTAVVRAPLTGIVLITEMTGGFTLLLPILFACSAAMLGPTLLGDRPVYDSLRDRTLRNVRSAQGY